jgi:hypothetical protein
MGVSCGWLRRLVNAKPRLFDHLVGAAEQASGSVRPSALAVLTLMTNAAQRG